MPYHTGKVFLLYVFSYVVSGLMTVRILDHTDHTGKGFLQYVFSYDCLEMLMK